MNGKATWTHARNVLCVRLDALGDALMTTPAMRALKESLQGRKITLLTSPAGAAVAPLLPEVDDWLIYSSPWMKATPPRLDSQTDLEIITRLRSARFDAAAIFTVFSQSALPAAMLCYLAGIPLRLAHCRENPYQLLTDWVTEPETGGAIRHEVRRQLDLVATVGARPSHERLSLGVPESARRRVTGLLQSLGVTGERGLWVVIHPGASAPSRRYAPERFADAARRLVLASGCQVLFTGDASERALVETIRARMDTPSHSVAGELSLAELAALIERAPILIANNTGPVHIAAAVGTPVVDLYALTNPQHTPWIVPSRVLNHDVPCQPCYKSTCPERHHHCLELVDPGEVVAAALELLAHCPLPGIQDVSPTRKSGVESRRRPRNLRRGSGSFSMYTLGVNAAYHDPAACLVQDGRVVAAAEDERFTHVKHGKRPVPFSAWELPFHAIDYCLAEAGIALADVDHIAYSYDPDLLLGSYRYAPSIPIPLRNNGPSREWESPWDPLFLSAIVNAPDQMIDGAPHHLQARFRDARARGRFRWHYVAHHLAHAASAFHASPFERAAVLTLDGRGERATTGYAIGHGTDLEWLGQVHMPHSLGILYEQATSYLGFLHSSDEYKVMALASFGKPRFTAEFFDMIHLGPEGRYTIDAPRLEERFGPARLRGGPLSQRHFDIAHSLQVVLEATVLELARWLHDASGCSALCMAGGVALNCVLNARIRDRGPFREIWVQPAAGDAGTALGAALWLDARERPRGERAWVMDHAFLGPAFDDAEIESFLRWSKQPYQRLTNIALEAAAILEQDRVIGWFQGRMEFGPRALGARSILASPLHASMQAKLNEIKDREDFRPVAPVVLEEEAHKWFVGGHASPFMLFVFDVQPDKAGQIPAVRHTDGTARIQTINRAQNPIYYDLIKAFQARTGVPVLVNTSFNTRGEPIVCTPRDAVESFWTSPLDALVIGPFLLEKQGNP